MKIRTPSKIILSGEYSVITKKTCITMPLEIYLTTEVIPNNKDYIIFNLPDINIYTKLFIDELDNFYFRCKKKYLLYKINNYNIANIFDDESGLAKFTFLSFIKFYKINIKRGLTITIKSDIPINIGLGSSSSLIINLIMNLSNFFSIKDNYNNIIKLAIKIENFQHGSSSGIDLKTILCKKNIYLNSGIINYFKSNLFGILVNTGKSNSPTIDCVTHVIKKFTKNDIIWQNMQIITKKIYNEIIEHSINRKKLNSLIYENNNLLMHMDVIPSKVKDFISILASNNIYAKICGAGSIKGDNCGILYIAENNSATINYFCNLFNYKILYKLKTNCM